MNSIQCMSDADCCAHCVCEIVNPMSHHSRCITVQSYVNEYGELIENE